jgi:hypothetical protein
MPGLGELALGAAPIAGGALFGIAAGSLKPPDVRGAINKDLDLLDRIPPEQADRRQHMQASIDRRIDALIAADERGQRLRDAAASYEGNWRDIIIFVSAGLFTIVWWYVSHDRANWLLMFILMIVLTTGAGIYAGRGIFRAVRHLIQDRPK